MKKIALLAMLTAILAAGAWIGLSRTDAQWAGVDEAVVEKFAHAAGRPAKGPLINTDQGDVLLFVFTVAGAIGGFVGGYCFRDLFGRS
jgi:ABC-type cobalt transport system substrate-binding protein